jgi:hypothetical protein
MRFCDAPGRKARSGNPVAPEGQARLLRIPCDGSPIANPRRNKRLPTMGSRSKQSLHLCNGQTRLTTRISIPERRSPACLLKQGAVVRVVVHAFSGKMRVDHHPSNPAFNAAVLCWPHSLWMVERPDRDASVIRIRVLKREGRAAIATETANCKWT